MRERGEGRGERSERGCVREAARGRAQGAAGALEAIFSLIMLDRDFITRSINVETLHSALHAAEIATAYVENAGLDSVMTNSFGFGGTNGSMVLSRYLG